jgi:hypothetical protein
MTVFLRLAAILAAKYSPAKRVAAEGCRGEELRRANIDSPG